MPWSDAPAITVVLVVALLALVVVPLAQMLGDGAGAQHGLEPLLELVAVLLGLLVVSVSLHALEAQEQARANVLVVGFGVAAACNFLHGVLVHSGPVHMPPGSADMSLWLSSWARVAEALTLGLTATRLSAPGPARAWLAAAGGVTLVLAGSALGPLPQWFAHAADGALRQVVAVGLALALAASAVLLYRRSRSEEAPRERLFAWAAGVFVCGEVTVGALGGHSTLGGVLSHGFRVVAYALLYQAVFDAGIRRPFARIQEAESRLRESEGRLSLLGRNLPHSVLFQIVRELDGRVHFVHMGDAIERLNGVRVQDVLQDPRVLYRQILPEDIDRLRQAERQSYLSMTSLEAVFRVRRTDGQVRWSQHPDTAHLSISVNVSARQFRRPGFVAEVLQTLKNHNADPRQLKLELTESLLLGDIEDTIARMVQLKSEGVGFSLDDFGTGYSSLSYLKRLPLDQVKIDQSFVRDVLTDPNDAAIVRTILALAKSLDLEVVAEGVETTGQLSFLRLHGCEGFQGYLFGRPGPVELFEHEHLPGHSAPSLATSQPAQQEQRP